MDNLEELDTEEDDMRMPGASTSYKSINYKNQNRVNGSSVASSSVMGISEYQYQTTDYEQEDEAPLPPIIEVEAEV